MEKRSNEIEIIGDQVKSLKRKNYYKCERLSLDCEWSNCTEVFEKVNHKKSNHNQVSPEDSAGEIELKILLSV